MDKLIFNILTYRAEPFLRSCQLYSHSRTSQHFMELKAHHHVHKSPPLVPILSQIDPVHTIPPYLSKIYFNIVYPPGLPSGLFLSGFPTNNLYASFFSPTRSTCPAHLILLHLIILIMFGEIFNITNKFNSVV
jgi:hypothetical protein